MKQSTRQFCMQTPPQDDNIVARLVSVTTPGSNTTEGLRSYVMNNTSKRAFECDWFRDIGDPAHCGGAELLLLFQLHQHALSDALSNLNSSLAELNRQKVSCSLGPLESRAMIGGNCRVGPRIALVVCHRFVGRL